MHFKIKLDIFHSKIDYYVGDYEINSFIKELKRRNFAENLTPEQFEIGNGVTCQDFIWLRHKDDYPSLVHENYHVVQNLKKYYGFDDEETEAYISGYLFEKYIDKINR